MLTFFQSSQLYNEIKIGNWVEESEFEKLRELRLLIEKLEINTHFADLDASNKFNFQGKIPREKKNLIDYIDGILNSFTEFQLKNYRNNLNSL